LEASARTLRETALAIEQKHHVPEQAVTWRVRFLDSPGRRIESIKACRAVCGIPLKDARDAVLEGRVFEVEPHLLEYHGGTYETLMPIDG
jgi:ribosomal protein L7/L12